MKYQPDESIRSFNTVCTIIDLNILRCCRQFTSKRRSSGELRSCSDKERDDQQSLLPFGSATNGTQSGKQFSATRVPHTPFAAKSSNYGSIPAQNIVWVETGLELNEKPTPTQIGRNISGSLLGDSVVTPSIHSSKNNSSSRLSNSNESSRAGTPNSSSKSRISPTPAPRSPRTPAVLQLSAHRGLLH